MNSIGMPRSVQPAPSMQSLEPVSMVSQGNSENERDLAVEEEEVVQRKVNGGDGNAGGQENERRSLQEVLGGGGSSVDGDTNDYKR